jgi:hypothetical protein
MLTNAVLSPDGKILSITVPFKIRKRSGRKVIIAPEGAEAAWAPTPARADAALVKALARAHRWKGMLDSGRFSSIKELAESEHMAERYIGNLLRLTLLAPDIVETILDGRLPKGIGLAQFMKPWPAVWAEQRVHLWSTAGA